MLFVIACSETDTEGLYPYIIEVDDPTAAVTPTDWKFGSASESHVFDVKSNADWKISASDDSWIVIDKKTGTGNGSFTITVSDNYATTSRSTTVSVDYSVNGSSKGTTITIQQGGMPKTGTHSNHDYIDLGIKDSKGKTIYWATSNLGADKPEDAGQYFAWGETVGYTTSGHSFTWASYKYCKGTESTLTKYNKSSTYGTVDNKKELELSDDAARSKWGGSWRMPTEAELLLLYNNCIWTWDSVNKGYKISNKSNSSKYIFLPAAGERDGSELKYVGTSGDYWSSTLNDGTSSYARKFWFLSSKPEGTSLNLRYVGLPIRAVYVP